MGLAQINIKFTADLSGFSTEMQNSIRRIGALGKELQNTGQNLSTYLSLPLLAAGGAAVKFASDYSESLNKVDVAFGTSSESVREFAKTSLENFGIAEGTALDMAATFGDMATSLGLPVDRAASMSKSLVGLAGDLASFKNISVDVANTALSGIFTGETESLKKLGIVMTEANLSAFTLSQGITKQVKDMSQAEKVGLRYNYILSVTKNAQGDFERTGGGAANQMRIFQESLKQVGQQLGSVILPAFTKLITYVNGAIKSFSGLSDETKTTIVLIAGIAAAIGPLLTGVGSLLTFVPNLISKINQLGTAFSGLTAIISANPYTALAIGIAAIAAGIFLWYKNTQQTVTAQESLNQAVEKGNKAAASEVGSLDRLYASATNVKLSIDERKAAIRSLQEQYPTYFKNLDAENIKNGQAVGVYKELRQAIFDKARATAIGAELDKRAAERVNTEFELRQKIADTEKNLEKVRKGAAVIVLQEANAMEKTKAVTITKNEAIRGGLILLQRQKDALKKFTEDALSSDQALIDAKSAYDSKTSKLTENEIERQKALIAQNALQVESVDKLKVGTIAYYESLISAAQKSQKEVALNNDEFSRLQTQIDSYQKKIDALEGKGTIKLPKPEIPSLGDDESPETPVFGLGELKNQKAYWEAIREQFSTTSDEYAALSANINNTQLKINEIEGVEEVKTQVQEVSDKVLQFKDEVVSTIQGSLEGFYAGIGEAIAGAFNGGNLMQGFGVVIFATLGDLLIQLGKIAIATGVAVEAIKKSLMSLSGIAAIGIGVGLVVLGSLVKSQVSGIAGYKDGGIVGGNSFYGDKILARVNSGELILNNQQQKKVFGMMNDPSGTNIVLQGDWSVRGDQIDLVLSRYQNNKNRKG